MNEPVPALRKERWLGFSTGTNENGFGNRGCSSEGTCGRVQGKWNKEAVAAPLPRQRHCRTSRHPLDPPAQGTKGPALSAALLQGPSWFLLAATSTQSQSISLFLGSQQATPDHSLSAGIAENGCHEEHMSCHWKASSLCNRIR